MITRQGKQYVLFAGLLDEAHQKGVRGIDTELVQVPTEENGRVAVVKARVEMEDGRTFSGIGDASPGNVGPNIGPHIIRMAETRAKARALRDAVNVGATALEELSDGDEAPPAGYPSTPPRGLQSVGKRQPTGSASSTDSAPNGRADSEPEAVEGTSQGASRRGRGGAPPKGRQKQNHPPQNPPRGGGGGRGGGPAWRPPPESPGGGPPARGPRRGSPASPPPRAATRRPP